MVPAFHRVLEDHTAGDTMKPEVIWTDLTPKEIRADLAEHDICVGEQVIRQLLEEEGFRRRQMVKYLDMGQHEDRNAQFENIARIKQTIRFTRESPIPCPLIFRVSFPR